jgi:hypothetical protein
MVCVLDIYCGVSTINMRIAYVEGRTKEIIGPCLPEFTSTVRCTMTESYLKIPAFNIKMQASSLECICAEGMRATCSNNEVSMIPPLLALLLVWMGYQSYCYDDESDEEQSESSNTMYS